MCRRSRAQRWAAADETTTFWTILVVLCLLWAPVVAVVWHASVTLGVIVTVLTVVYLAKCYRYERRQRR